MSDHTPPVTPKVPTTPRPLRIGSKGKGKGKGKAEVKEVPKKPPILPVLLRRLKIFLRTHGIPLLKELFSEDRPTRNMTIFFIFCVAGFITLMSVVFFNCGSSRMLQLWGRSQDSAREKIELLHRQRERADLEASWLVMERFEFELRSTSGDRPGAGQGHIAEFDISVQGDSPETRHFLEGNIVQARNTVIKSLVGWDREALMTAEGKKKLRQNISDALNTWLPEGKVLDLYFVRFLFK